MSDEESKSDGVGSGDIPLTPKGVAMSDGPPSFSCGVLMGDGVMMTGGVNDGGVLGERVVMSALSAAASRAMHCSTAT